MTQKLFLQEFDDSDFPSEKGPWISTENHDPPWTEAQLRKMAKQGLIEIHQSGNKYRLTMKATAARAFLLTMG